MKRNVLTQYLIITASCALYAVGFNWMFDPNHISVGGFTGLGQIINYLLPGLPIGTIVIILNVPLFVLGWRFIGKDFLFSSVYATAVSSLMIDGLAAVYTFKPMEPILACLYGGVIIGVSCGIMLREGATTGGTELAARLLKLKLESLSIGTLCLAIDILVTVTYALIFRDLTRALYGMISLSLISVSIDKVVYGPNAAKECPAGADQRRGQGGNHLALPRRQRASRPAGGGAGVSGGAEGDAAGSLRRGVPDLYGGRDTSEL